jgi:exopolysaccharide biosynthesis WecB/TagA/CpsF family protein
MTAGPADRGRRVVGGVAIDLLTRRELAERMSADCREAKANGTIKPRLDFSANGQGLSMVAADRDFRRLFAAADIVHADGQPLVLFSRLTAGEPVPERCATTDFFHDACEVAVRDGLRFYFLGADRVTLNAAVDAVRKRYPGLAIAGSRDGYFPDNRWFEVVAEIAASRPDVVWIGLGRGKQEAFCVRARDALGGVGWLKTCGGLFGHLAGNERRAPGWMQKAGLEWFWRLVEDPRGKAWRYLVTNFHAVWLLLTRTGR